MRTDIGPSSRRLLVGAMVLLVCGSATIAHAERTACDRSRTRRVLFIGNSFMYFHNVPKMVEGIAASLPGPCIETAMIASGGASLATHWSSDSAAARIRQGHWTHVVLNDQSTFGERWLIDGVSRVGTTGRELDEYGRKFIDVIRSVQATPVLVSHWADDGDPERDQQALDYLFDRLARSTNTRTVPAGLAVKRLRKAMPNVTPYFADDHHLSPAGAYLVALTTYATVAEASPIGAPGSIRGPAVELNRGIVFPDSIVPLVALPADQAAAIQRLAQDTYVEWQARKAPVSPPAALEMPKVPERGDAVSRDILRGRWVGPTWYLTSMSGKPSTMELVLGTETSGDSVLVKIPRSDVPLNRRVPFEFTARADVKIEADRITFTAAAAPNDGIVQFRAVLRNGMLVGAAEFSLGRPGTEYALYSIGRLELQRADR